MTDNFTEAMLAGPVRDSIVFLMMPVGAIVSFLMYRAGMADLRRRVF